MIKRYSDFINEGLTVGELPDIDWLNILCEHLNDNLINIVILTDRLCDDVGRLVSATDGRYIINNEVFACTEIHFQNNNRNLSFEEVNDYKSSISRIQKKIELESYKVIGIGPFLKPSKGHSAFTYFAQRGTIK